jgi:hypothetical protein
MYLKVYVSLFYLTERLKRFIVKRETAGDKFAYQAKTFLPANHHGFMRGKAKQLKPFLRSKTLYI